jgi:hypothetical protein
MTLDKSSTENILEKHGSGYIMNKKKIDIVANAIEQEKIMQTLKSNAELVALVFRVKEPSVLYILNDTIIDVFGFASTKVKHYNFLTFISILNVCGLAVIKCDRGH